MSSSTFVDAFFAIDSGGSGRISTVELSRYFKEQNYTDNFVTKWLRLLDSGGTGFITLEQLSATLGLDAGQVRGQRPDRTRASAASASSVTSITDLPGARSRTSAASVSSVASTADLPGDFTAISTDMPHEMQLRILQILGQGQQLCEHEKDLVKYLKQQCDIQLGRLWHSVIVSGQFWCWYSHEPGHSFIFRQGKLVFCVWRSPGY